MWMASLAIALRQLVRDRSYEVLLIVINVLFLFAVYTLVDDYLERNRQEIGRLVSLLDSCLSEQYKDDDFFGGPGATGMNRVPFGPR